MHSSWALKRDYLIDKLQLVQNAAAKIITKLEAHRERRPPWPRHIITPILPTVKMLSLGGKRLPPTKKKEKSFGSLPAPRSGYATTVMVVFSLIYSS